MKTFLLCTAFASAVLFGGCASSTTTRYDPAPSSPAGHAWTLASLNGEPVTASGEMKLPELRFTADGLSASGYAGVNGFVGRADFKGGELKFGPLATTRRAGPEEWMRIESAYTAALARVSAWKIEGRQLVLLAKDQPVLVFELQPPRVQE